MADEPLSALTQISPPPFTTAFTNPTTGAMLEILDTTNTTMATTGTNSKIAPGDLIKGYLAAGTNVTLTETSGIVTIAASGGGVVTSTYSNVISPLVGPPPTQLSLTMANVPGTYVTLPVAGTYVITANVRARVIFTGVSGNAQWINAQLYDQTNSIALPSSISLVCYGQLQTTQTAFTIIGLGPVGPAVYTPATVPATIYLQANYTASSGTNVNAYVDSDSYGYTSLTAVRIA